MTTTVGQILAQKGNKAMAVQPDSSILDALQLMADHDIGAVLVVQGEQLLGIFTEREKLLEHYRYLNAIRCA